MHFVSRWSSLALLALATLPLAAVATPPSIYAPDFPGAESLNWSKRPVQLYVGYPYQYRYSALGDATSYQVDGLPAGLTCDPTTGVISGTPQQDGEFPLVLKASNAAGETGSLAVTLTVQPVPTTAPTIQEIGDFDTSYAGTQFGDSFYGKHNLIIMATEGPTSYSAAGLPPGAQFDAAKGFVYYEDNATVPGTYHCTLSATNAVGTGSTSFVWRVHPAIPDFGIQPNRTHFITGDVIAFTVTFNAAVMVTGAPTLDFAYGKSAVFSSGSGTSTLVFTYQTTLDDGDISGYTPYTITLNGGTIIGADGLSAQVFEHSSRNVNQPQVLVFSPHLSATAGSGAVGTPFTLAENTSPDAGADYRVTEGSLPDGLTLNPFTGDITGTPTTAGTSTFKLQASNRNGVVLAEDVTITISSNASPAPGPTDNPPPTTNPPPTQNPPPTDTPPPTDNPPPTDAKSDQTITFSSPVSALLVGRPVTLGALSSAGLPVTYSVVSGDATISGNLLTPTSTATLVVRASSAGNGTVNPASIDVNFGQPQKQAQVISTAPTGGSVPAELPVALAATSSSGLPVTYNVVSGPAEISHGTLTFTGTGQVVVRASQSGDGTFAPASDVTLIFTAKPVDRLVNLSTRIHVNAGDASQGAIAGFVITGSAPKPVLIRAVGPTLSSFGVTTPLSRPELRVFDAKATLIATNGGWNDDAQIAAAGDAVGAFALAPGSRDAAVLLTLAPGEYTAQVQSGGAGTVLVEVYDVSANAAVPTKQLINISARGTVGAGDDVIIGGFVVSGAAPKRVLLRAIGPALSTFGVANVVSDPVLTLYDSGGAVLARNDNWETAEAGSGVPLAGQPQDITDAESSSGAFALPGGSRDAAMVVTLNPGRYSVVASGANGATGAAIVEVYEVP
jgi:hypothetical protein